MGGGGGRSANDIFADLFGGGGGGRPRERKGEDVRHVLNCTLEDFYNGATRKLAMTREVACETCNGVGTKSGKEPTCGNCRGQGVEVVVQRMGPMITQMQRPCSACGGSGKQVDAGDRCGGCRGNRSVPERKVMEVHIDKGMKHGDRVVLRGEAGFSGEAGVPSGDLVFVLQQKEHGTFKRVKQDLVYECKISLAEALCGTKIPVKTLDKEGRTIVVAVPPGKVIAPDSFHKVEGEGMPVRGAPFQKGNLYIQFDVQFPNQLDGETANVLRNILTTIPGQLPSRGESLSPCFHTEERQMIEDNQIGLPSSQDIRRARPRAFPCAGLRAAAVFTSLDV